MRLAVISDIHGNLRALEAVLADLASVGEVDQVWCLGDLAAFGPQPGACIARLRELLAALGKERCRIIGGNTDRYLVQGTRAVSPPAKDSEGLQRRIAAFVERDAVLNWGLAQLTWDDYELLAQSIGRELHLRVPDYGTVIGVHAVPGDDEALAFRPDATAEIARDALLDREGRLVLAGHTHLVMDREVGTWRIINPGSVGLSFTQPGWAEWALLTFQAGALTVDLRGVPFDVPAVLAEAAALGYPDLAGLRLRLTETPKA